MTRKTASGIRLLRGREYGSLQDAVRGIRLLRSASTWASEGMAVTGLGCFPRGSGEFIGSTLSAIKGIALQEHYNDRAKRDEPPACQRSTGSSAPLAADLPFKAYFTSAWQLSPPSPSPLRLSAAEHKKAPRPSFVPCPASRTGSPSGFCPCLRRSDAWESAAR